MFGIADPALPDSFRPFSCPHLVSQIIVRHIKIDATLLHLPQRLPAEKSRVSRHSLRPRLTLPLHFLHHRHQRPVVGRVLRHPRGHNQMIVAHRQIRRVAQLPALRRAQKPALRVGQRNLLPSFFRQRRHRLLFQRALLFHTQTHSSIFFRILLTRLLLIRPHQTPILRPLLPPPPLPVHHLAPRRIRPHPRRVDGHMPQLAQPRTPRHLHHLREPIVDRPPVPPQKLAQRFVIRRQPARQITERQVLVHPPLQPRVELTPRQKPYNHTRSIIAGGYAIRPSAAYAPSNRPRSNSFTMASSRKHKCSFPSTSFTFGGSRYA